MKRKKILVIKLIRLQFSPDKALRYQNLSDKPNSQQVKVRN